MSNVKKCDRCKTIIEEGMYSIKEWESPEAGVYSGRTVNHLCTSCFLVIEEFIEKGKDVNDG